MYRLAILSASSTCLSSYITLPPPPPPSSKAESAGAMACKSRQQRRGFYTAFVLLLALLGVTTSHSAIIEFICQRVGKQNTCDVHRCAPGEAPQHRPYSRPEYNGCGTYELKVNLATSDFEQCCNIHDLCYGSCGRQKQECDRMFYQCMASECQQEAPGSKASKRCLREARLYFNAVYAFGCFAYKRAQKKHCECRPAGSPATYFDLHEHDLQASLQSTYQRAAPANQTGAYKPKWEEFL